MSTSRGCRQAGTNPLRAGLPLHPRIAGQFSRSTVSSFLLPGLCFVEIVLKIMRNHAQFNYEVIAMKEINLGRRNKSRKLREPRKIKAASGRKQTKFDCYRHCMDDPWEMKGESVCASACGVKFL